MDRISRKLFRSEALPADILNPTTGRIRAQISLHSDVPADRRDGIINSCLVDSKILSSGNGFYLVEAARPDLMCLSGLSEVQFIHEASENIYTNDVSKIRTNVNSIQNINTGVFPPSPTWMAGAGDTTYGRGIWIGIYDTGIDTIFNTANTPNDFREQVGGVSTTRRAQSATIFWHEPTRVTSNTELASHGTHVAGIAGGNGWRSETSGGTRYQWRGVAPKALFISQTSDPVGFDGDVNNHSHITGFNTEYVQNDQAIDNLIARHNPNHVMVYAAANNGLTRGHGQQRGFYSILANTKNAITVGATTKEDNIKAPFSSMGPTRDGRIKPDIMAPGASANFPQTLPTNMRVEFDYVRLRGPGGHALNFEFNNSANGWQNQYATSSHTLKPTSWSFLTDWIGCFIERPGITGFTSNLDDTLIIRYKIVHPQIPSKLTSLACGFSWGPAADADSLRFNLATPDTNFREFRARLRDLRGRRPGDDISIGLARWTGGLVINRLQLNFRSDTAGAIYSPVYFDGTAPRYAHLQGTSMAAPHVSGIAALVLEAWARRMLLNPALNIHDNGPWNSTIKAILVHTATDLVKTTRTVEEQRAGGDGVTTNNPDLCGITPANTCSNEPLSRSFLKYYAGPDYATGYGLVNAQVALSFVSQNNRVIQDSILDLSSIAYTFQVPAGIVGLRTTLVWDDPPGTAGLPFTQSLLINDLDLVLQAPNGVLYRPWVLNPLPQNATTLPDSGLDPIDSIDVQPAFRGINTRDNVEVVDAAPVSGFLPSGEWKVIVRGSRVRTPRPGSPNLFQHFSLVNNYQTVRKDVSVGWLWTGNACPEGDGFFGMDDEDDAPQGTVSFIKSGWSTTTWTTYTGNSGVWSNNGETNLKFCRDSRNSLPRVKSDYAVLRLSNSCPTNGFPFTRVTDNEDNGNGNTNSTGITVGGSITPSTQSAAPTSGWTNMEFCFVPGDGSATVPPWKTFHHGAMTGVNADVSGCPEFHWHVEDDEDNGNQNYFIVPVESQVYDARIKALFNNSTTETHYFWNACP